MLCPNSAIGSSAHGASTSKIASASSGMLSMQASLRRSCRPGYCTAKVLMSGASAADIGW